MKVYFDWKGLGNFLFLVKSCRFSKIFISLVPGGISIQTLNVQLSGWTVIILMVAGVWYKARVCGDKSLVTQCLMSHVFCAQASRDQVGWWWRNMVATNAIERTPQSGVSQK